MLYPIGEYLISGGDAAKLAESSRAWRILEDGLSAFGILPGIAAGAAISGGCLVIRQISTSLRNVYKSAITHRLARSIRQELFGRVPGAHLSFPERSGDGVL